MKSSKSLLFICTFFLFIPLYAGTTDTGSIASSYADGLASASETPIRRLSFSSRKGSWTTALKELAKESSLSRLTAAAQILVEHYDNKEDFFFTVQCGFFLRHGSSFAQPAPRWLWSLDRLFISSNKDKQKLSQLVEQELRAIHHRLSNSDSEECLIELFRHFEEWKKSEKTLQLQNPLFAELSPTASQAQKNFVTNFAVDAAFILSENSEADQKTTIAFEFLTAYAITTLFVKNSIVLPAVDVELSELRAHIIERKKLLTYKSPTNLFHVFGNDGTTHFIDEIEVFFRLRHACPMPRSDLLRENYLSAALMSLHMLTIEVDEFNKLQHDLEHANEGELSDDHAHSIYHFHPDDRESLNLLAHDVRTFIKLCGLAPDFTDYTVPETELVASMSLISTLLKKMSHFSDLDPFEGQMIRGLSN